eukprot:TRINITY_DN1724_c0_g1_i3.p1 TRINITY_DN1724_c0_g1~~TRINITY_DN1724_c0_g1_i3.p1  ORF type:complete len:537 (-),score=37.48 TRINITY_DN1724_c0_g1_i3:293-1825(-)
MFAFLALVLMLVHRAETTTEMDVGDGRDVLQRLRGQGGSGGGFPKCTGATNSKCSQCGMGSQSCCPLGSTPSCFKGDQIKYTKCDATTACEPVARVDPAAACTNREINMRCFKTSCPTGTVCAFGDGLAPNALPACVHSTTPMAKFAPEACTWTRSLTPVAPPAPPADPDCPAGYHARVTIKNLCHKERIGLFYSAGVPNKPVPYPSQGSGSWYVDSQKSMKFCIPDEGMSSTMFWAGFGNCSDTGRPKPDNIHCEMGSTRWGFTAADGAAPDTNSRFEATFGCLEYLFWSDWEHSRCAKNLANGETLSPDDNADSSVIDGYTHPFVTQVSSDALCHTKPKNGIVDCSKLSLRECPRMNYVPATLGTDVDTRLHTPKKPDNVVGCAGPGKYLTTDSRSTSASGGWFHSHMNREPYTPADQYASAYLCDADGYAYYANKEHCANGPWPPCAYSQYVNSTGCPSNNAYTFAYSDWLHDHRGAPEVLWRCSAQHPDNSKIVARYEYHVHCPIY